MNRQHLAVVFLAVLFLGSGCGPQGSGNSQGRVLLIGVDGATFRVIGPMMKEGLLPNFERFVREGASGPLRSQYPLLSPRIWTSIATGKIPRAHGIGGWVWKDRNGALQLFTSHNRKTHAIWNILSDKGRSVGVVNWLMTHPPEKVNGVMISDFAFPFVIDKRRGMAEAFGKALFPGTKGGVERPIDTNASFAYPPIWTQKFADLKNNPVALTSIKDPFVGDPTSSGEKLSEYFSTVFLNDGLSTRIAIEIHEEVNPDLLMVYLPGVDRLSHFLWAGQEPIERYPENTRLTPERHAAHRTALRNYYRYVDGLIGALADGYGSNDLVLVLSDHGFEAGGRKGGSNPLPGVHETNSALDGVFFARGAGIPAGCRLPKGELSVNDITPTILAWFGLPIAEDMQGRPAHFLDLPLADIIATYDTNPIERLQAKSFGVEETVMKQLKSLGYVKESCEGDNDSPECGNVPESVPDATGKP